MLRQHELIGPQPLGVTPAAGQVGPRLWIRRLAIWKEPGGENVRDIQLAPGLNIVWSPDRSDRAAEGGQKNAIGHGSGKTLFCRLIRYCLGEDRFSPEVQRERIGTAFLNGIVGAEVMLDGICWAVVRPLGIRRRHMAVANGNLNEIAAGEGASTGLEPLIDAIDQSIITAALADLVRPRRDGPAWPVALAWLTRDQECRFDDVLDWRSPSSDSDSPLPASGREKGPRLEALRAFLMAITPEEQATRTQINGLDERYRVLDQEIGHRQWEIDRAQAQLVVALGQTGQTLPEMPLLIDHLRKTASERVVTATKLPADGKAELVAARREFESARLEWMRLDGERIRVETSIPIEERVLSEIQGELPGLSFSKVEAETQICPICEVPIDRALAENCKLSHKLQDPEDCRTRWEKRKREFEVQGQKLGTFRQQRTRTLQQLSLAKQKLDQMHGRVAAIESARDSREASWYSARSVQDDVERLTDLFGVQDAAMRKLSDITTKLESERGQLGAFRDKQARVFGRLSEKFDPIVRRLLGLDARGRVALSGNGIELSIDLGGERATAAIDSLKVLAFDLAALCLSIEGETRVPAFLLHDSPREADLGLSIYHELFRCVREIEELSGQPLFQYIVTTTTEPPDTFKTDPSLRLVICGAPAEERLLRTDL
jgi:hypothetical protein